MTNRLTGKMPSMAIYGGIDLGGTKIQAAVVDEDDGHRVLGAKRDQTPLKGGPKAIAARMAAVLEESLEEAVLTTSDLAGVGVGSPGSVDDVRGTVSGAMNLSEWAGSFNLRRALEKELGGTPVALGNDVDLATDAEFEIGACARVHQPARRLLGHRGRRRRGPRRQAVGRPQDRGEIGHMVVRLNGAMCPCGRRGCMEAYAGRGAMEARARKRVEHGEKTALFKIMEERGRDGSPRASGSVRWRATTTWRSTCSKRRSRRSAPGSPPRSTCSTRRRS